MARRAKRKPLNISLAAVGRWSLKGGRPVALLLLILMLVWRGADPGGFLEIGRAKVFDFYQQIHPRERPIDRPVTVVDIDEPSLAALGQWPWSRVTVAEIVVNLFNAGAAVVAFDIVFAEPDRLSPSVVAASLEGLDAATAKRLKAMKSNDAILADIFQQAGRVVLGQTVVAQDVAGRERENMPATSIAALNGDPSDYLEHHSALLRNIPVIDEAAAGRGIFNVTPEPDGVVRRIPAAVKVAGTIYPALTVEMLRVATGQPSIMIRMPKQGEDILGIKDFVIRPSVMKTDSKGRIFLYAARYDRNSYVSAKDIKDGTFDPAMVAGKLVILGTSAAGLLDIRTTALDRQIPGVDVHAQIIETVLGNMQLSIPLDADFVEKMASIGAALLMIVLVPMIGARWTLMVFLGVVGAMAGWSWWQFVDARSLYDPVFPASAAGLLFVQMTYWGYASEEAQRRQVRTAFGRYLSPALVEKLAKDPSHLKLGGEMRDMTLLFCDVRGFTTISELFDAQGLTRFINRFLTPMTNVILDRYGTIDKYMGDCIMAFWNAPLDDDDHARHACEAALAMMETLGPLNDTLEAEAKQENRRHVPIKVGIGLNSGPVCVGNMGSDQRFDYSVLGDTVNLASRLEGQSKPYGVLIIIGDETRKRAPDYAALELDLIKVKGKTEAVRIWTLLGRPDMVTQAWFGDYAAAHNAMLAAYRAQNWPEARAQLTKAMELRGELHVEGFYALMEERIGEFEAHSPGAEWDGVFTATSK
ncbi:MAG: adenylate/guanylate cyclase domain-containing protein [Rhodospirillaceae bacterium]|nr:adenylate/guanylate cyclase domain-containing protein [Rhodospirillales bacterium]